MTDRTELMHVPRQRFTLRKSAKLRHRTLVNDLFRKGRSVYAGPLRVTFRTLSAEELASSFRMAVPDLMGPVQMLVTIPKKKRRHAVDRVLMRRRIREAFRLQWLGLRRQVADDPEIRTLSLGIVYMHTENVSLAEVSDAMAQAIAKIRKKLGAPAEGATNG